MHRQDSTAMGKKWFYKCTWISKDKVDYTISTASTFNKIIADFLQGFENRCKFFKSWQ
jgi:hypothetical protein